LRAQLDAPRALRDYGMPADGIAEAVGPIMAAIPANNPRTVSEDSLTVLLRAAWAGEEPS
jgi:maleylacetate reductase